MKPLIYGAVALGVGFFAAQTSQAQLLSWSSYDTNGTLVSASAASGSSPTFTIPANTTYTFITTNFTPVVIGSGTTQTINFVFNASGGFGTNASIQNVRALSFGLFNYSATAPGATGNFTDDVGLYTDFYQQTANPVNIEMLAGTASTNLLSYNGSNRLGSAVGPSTGAAGFINDATSYSATIRLVNNAGTLSFGTSANTNATSGVVYTDTATGGTNTNRDAYSAGATSPTGNFTGNEFGIGFVNSTGSPVTLQVSSLGGINAVPEPSSAAALLIGGALTLPIVFRRRRKL